MRLGSVSYLNAQPLLHGLNAKLATPTVLAAMLRAGEVDAALVPVVEAIEHGPYWLVDGVAIGCDGPVYSVVLTLEKRIENVRRVALDPASRTSARLTRWLFEEHFRRPVRYVAANTRADATLRIGDPAIAFRQAHPEMPVLDLGEAWKAATGLPFVFAVWALRNPDAALASRLRQAARDGLAAREQLARQPWQREYLFESIRYELGDRQREGLNRFASCIAASWQPRWI